MLGHSIKTRAAIFAILFGPPRFIKRTEATGIYNALSERLGLEDMALQYNQQLQVPPQGPAAVIAAAMAASGAKPFSIVCERSDGRSTFKTTIDSAGGQHPIRLLIENIWPESPEHVAELLDMTCEAVFGELRPEGTENWQRILMEVRIRAQCSAPGRDAVGFIRDRVLRVSPEWLEAMGKPLTLASVKFEVASGAPLTGPLDNPKRELQIEVLRDDPASLYFELMSQWSAGPQVVVGNRLDPSGARPLEESPSKYFRAASEFLAARVSDLETGGRA